MCGIGVNKMLRACAGLTGFYFSEFFKAKINNIFLCLRLQIPSCCVSSICQCRRSRLFSRMLGSQYFWMSLRHARCRAMTDQWSPIFELTFMPIVRVSKLFSKSVWWASSLSLLFLLLLINLFADYSLW